MQRSKGELEQMFTELIHHGAVLRPGVTKPGRLDYMQAVGDWWLKKRQSDGVALPGEVWLQNNIDTPMLAQSTSKLDGALQKAIRSPLYAIEEKLNGARILCSYFPGVGFEFHGRNRSVMNCLFCNYTDQVYGFGTKDSSSWFKASFILDGELMSVNPSIAGRKQSQDELTAVEMLLALDLKSSHEAQVAAGLPLRFNVFDILFYNDQSLLRTPYSKRLEVLNKLLPAMEEKIPSYLRWFFTGVDRLFNATPDDKQAFYSKIVAANREGCVLRHKEAPYNSSTGRGGGQAPIFKWKKTLSEAIGSDIDAFVIGGSPGTAGKAYENKIAILHFGIYLEPSGEQHHIASCSGLSDEERNRITTYDASGAPVISSDILGQVAVINGLAMSAVSKRFQHCRIVRWRTDKRKEECTLDERLLDSLVLGR